MRVVLQRVLSASVTIDNKVKSQINQGILLLVAIHQSDSPEKAIWMAKKCLELRIFSDDLGKMNLSLADIRGQVLVVSQFTLYGDCSKGRRPGFSDAASPEKGDALYNKFINELKLILGDNQVYTGVFGADMKVSLVNDGPVTLIIDR